MTLRLAALAQGILPDRWLAMSEPFDSLRSLGAVSLTDGLRSARTLRLAALAQGILPDRWLAMSEPFDSLRSLKAVSLTDGLP